MDKYSKEFFQKAGSKGGNKTKETHPKDYYKKIRAQRGKKTVSVIHNKGIDDKKEQQ